MSTSTASPTPEHKAKGQSVTPTATARQRVLACVLCQQRKVKCDRKFPCINCVRTGAQCVPSLAPRPRRPRFPERELLGRLQHYESLLRQNNIEFDPLHSSPAAVEHTSPSEDGRGSDSIDDGQAEVPREKTTVKSESRYPDRTYFWIRSLWNVISQISFQYDNDEMRDAVIKHAWDITYQSESHDHLLFGSPKQDVHLATLHPEQVQIFKLWQTYLENVNPLLKVTHTPTLQARIIDAASDVANISPTLEALIFSIYCVAVLSLGEDECHTLFRSSRKDLLANYQFACKQALLNCRAWQSDNRDCLTAFYLYLVSVRPVTDPRSLSSLLAVAIRVAQRMGINDESSYARSNALEAEMRRRLWWSLVIFDSHVSEMLDYKTATLAPTWDCRPPLNVDDSEIRVEMKTSPAIHDRPTEAIFAVVHSELSDFVRHISRTEGTRHDQGVTGIELSTLEKTIEDKYIAFCDPGNPLNFMTIWTTRGYLAKNRLLEHYSKHSMPFIQQTDTQRNASLSFALSMLDCDTKLIASPLTKSFLWLVHFDFPFLAYVHILQDLRERPNEEHVQQVWSALSDNYEARVKNPKRGEPIIIVFSRVILHAWEACELSFREQGKPVDPPRIVSDIRDRMTQMMSRFSHCGNIEEPTGTGSTNTTESQMPMPMGFDGYSTEGQYFAGSRAWGYPAVPGQAGTDANTNQFWPAMDWSWMQPPSW